MEAEPLTLALDATLWDEPTTGIGLYTRCLAEGLAQQGVRPELLGARLSGTAPRGAQSATLFSLGILPSLLASRSMPLYHAVGNFNLPLQRIPGTRLVLTVHDLIPELLPQSTSRAFRWQFSLWLSRSLQVADRVVCVSEQTRRDLLERHPVDPGRVVTVHHGVDHVHQVPAPDATTEAYLGTLGLDKPFILYAGSLDGRKNVELLLTAVEQLSAEGLQVPVVLVGQSWFGSGPVERRIANLRARGARILALGYQPAEVLQALLRRATVFVFPSRYEGFGLPPLEAMAQGAPVIAARTGALPEVLGEAALWVDPDDSQKLATLIRTLLGSQPERDRLRALGRAQAARFTWARTAASMLELYREVLAGSPSPAQGTKARNRRAGPWGKSE